MKNEVSESKQKPYPVRLVLKVAGLSPAAWYDKRPRIKEEDKLKRGPKTTISDNGLLEGIMEILKEPLFSGEGYIKIHSRLKRKNIRVGKNRVYRIMLKSNLLNNKYGNPGSGRAHDGTIITEHPNKLWATDGKQFYTKQEGKCWFIGVIDHFNDEIKSFHLCKTFDRYAAMEPLRDAVASEYGSVAKDVCKGMDIALRADHGSQFDSKTYQREIEFLGINYSPAFIRSPECNGIIERFHRTLNEQIFFQESFEDIEHARQRIGSFVGKYNEKWLLHRLKLQSPIEYRQMYELNKNSVN
jgi:transposase InsO family protein